jgi:hypothetical protein
MRRFFFISLAIAACAMAVKLQPKAAAGPTSKPSASTDRAKWEGRILFFGDEATGEWSLRVHDADVDAQRQFRLRQLWTYNRESKRWERMGTHVLSAWMLPPGKTKQDPDAEPDPDHTQTLAELPIEKDEVGLFYAKWSVDDVRGATFCRIGTGLDKKSDYVHKPPAEGQIWVVLPVDINHSVPAFIANPELACKSAGD